MDKKAPFKMIYDGGHFIDGMDCDTGEEARDAALETLCEWMAEEQGTWKSEKPTPLEIERWNWMIEEMMCWIQVYDPETDDYDDTYLTDEDLESIGWKEIPEDEESED